MRREIHRGGGYCDDTTVHDALKRLVNGDREKSEIQGGDAAVIAQGGATFTCTQGSGVIRGGLGYALLYEGELYGRPDILKESKLAEALSGLVA